jgi:quercetin dioxygenase-like cupin family protein
MSASRVRRFWRARPPRSYGVDMLIRLRYSISWDYSPTKLLRELKVAVIKGVPIVRADGEGEKRWFYGGGLHTWKASAEETGGAFLLFEDSLSFGKTTPLHTHPEADETIYMLDGEILLHVDGRELRLGSRGIAVAQRGVPHAFLVTSKTARMLCLQTPGICEAFFRGASEPADSGFETQGPVDFARVYASAKEHGGIEIIGPPPFSGNQGP